MCTYIYIYIYRERERERDTYVNKAGASDALWLTPSVW